ncbi:MAG: hypothetical protein IJU40_02330, partial [Desulfovibrionaceae bacterium]|nr:hypothetical protein [Desulfovibrionaceae bacterium]
KVTARCFKRGQEIIICVDTPGPCQISFGLVDAKGKYVAGPLNFEDERFGRKSFSLKFPYPSSEEQSVKYQFKAQGHLFRYKRVPVEEDASLGSKFRVKTGLADPSEYKFVLKDKKGQAFKLDIPVVFTKTPKGEISLFFNGLKIN